MGPSRFAVLDIVEDDEEWAAKLTALKEKVHSLPGPSRQPNMGLAHSRAVDNKKKGHQGEKLTSSSQKQTGKVGRTAKAGRPPLQEVSNRLRG